MSGLKRLVCFLCLQTAYVFSDELNQNAQNKIQEECHKRAVEGLIERLLPENVQNFTVKVHISMKIDHKDVYILQQQSAKSPLEITASSGVAAAAALHHYLKYFCAAHISWDFNQLNLSKCQKSNIYVKVSFNDRYRYYQNACTPSYSFVWYDWEKWEQHIDWMVLQGFNLVPAQNGQEEIWRRVYNQLGFEKEEIDAHFAGPAFLAWNRMGNLQGWGGPLSRTWHVQQLQMNKKVIQRMRSFGIKIVLPAFAGQVPRSLKRIYPNATFYDLPQWNSFNGSYITPYLLDPKENLFNQIATMFLKETTNEFGTDHIYNCDTFNEMTPFTTDLDQLKEIGSMIYSSMTSFDPDSIWLMQGWIFHHEILYWTKERAKAWLTSVPQGKMIILDLQAEQNPQYQRLDNYFGQPYIWCMLHNFGGTLGMFGSAEIINTKVFEARNATNSTLIGTGITPEGIDQNYMIYDLMIEMFYRKSPANLTLWVGDYATRRYGFNNNNITLAWNILLNTVYSFNGSQMMRGKFVYNRSPRTKILPWTWYSHAEFVKAQQLFFHELDNLCLQSVNCYHDYVDVTRQVLQNLADDIYTFLMMEFRLQNLDKFLRWKRFFETIFDLIEDTLSTDLKWLLGRWLNDARKMASTQEEADLFEYNARNQITLWGPRGEIMDYANKQWSERFRLAAFINTEDRIPKTLWNSILIRDHTQRYSTFHLKGVVKDFFKPRWQLFLSHMEDSLKHEIKFNEKGARKDVFDKVEEPFTFSHKQYPITSITNVTWKAKTIQNKIDELIPKTASLSNAGKQAVKRSRSKKKERRN